MKAEELRIGNWVLSNGQLKQFNYFSYPMGDEQNRVAYFYPNTSGHKDEHDNLNNLEPVPLTPEILEACGFEKDGGYHPHGTFYTADNFFVLFVHNDGKITFSFENDWAENVDVEIKHLHQLQNLFFSLTGQELKIELNENILSPSKAKGLH